MGTAKLLQDDIEKRTRQITTAIRELGDDMAAVPTIFDQQQRDRLLLNQYGRG